MPASLPIRLSQSARSGPLAKVLAEPVPDGAVVLHWLGQAGFVAAGGGHRILIDPYLSDSLSRKYRGTATPHERMMTVPVGVEALPPLDLVLVTHQHTDHMDPETLGPLATAQPHLRFVVPAASEEEARKRIGVGSERLIPVDAGWRGTPLAHLRVEALPAAHETVETDSDGRHRFLGYAMTFDLPRGRSVTVIHSGDTVPFDGYADRLKALAPDLLLLPVNGRSEALRGRGVAGNLHLEEAVSLCAASGAPAMVAHHHGMFAFNSRPLADIEALAASPGLPVRLIPARPGLEVRLEGVSGSA